MTYETLKRTGASLAVVGAMMAVDAAPAFAQLSVEEIVVTTRKRAESLQEVPLVIKAFTADDLQRKGLNSIEDVARLTSGVTVDQGTFPQDVRVTIRGLAPSRGRPNVALLLDGVDVSSEAVQSAGGSLLINSRLFDLERVEIVKGPQSALYGRSAFAGAINYVTKKPTNEWEGTVNVTAGQRGQYDGSVGLYGPLVEDKLLIGMNASIWNFDGFYDNTVTGADVADSDGVGFALSTITNFNEDISLTARAEYTDDHLGQSAFAFVGQNTQLPVPPGAYPTAPFPFSTDGVISPSITSAGVFAGKVPDASDIPGLTISEDPITGQEFRGSEREIFRFAGEFEINQDWGTFTSVTHYADADVSQASENTRQGSFNTLTAGTLFRVDSDTQLFSQEVRVQSNDDEQLRWMFGGLYWDEDVDQRSNNIACTNNQVFPFAPFIPCGPSFAVVGDSDPNMWTRDTKHWSSFFMVEYDFSEQLTAHIEGRYTDEEQYISGPTGPRIVDALGINPPFIPNLFPASSPNVDATSSDSFFTPRFSLEYTANDDMLFYGSIAKGAKPGGISTVGAGASGFIPEQFAFDQENMWVYELGTKTSWADGRVIVNAAVYYEDFSGKQTSSQIQLDNGLVGTRTVNASSAEVKGLEIDAAWAPTDGMNLSVGYSYIDATYGDFKTNSSGVAAITAVGNCNQIDIGTPGNPSFTCEIDRTGNRLEDVAKHSLVFGASYEQPLTDDINWLIETDVQYNGNRFDTADNIAQLQSYWMVDLRAGVSTDNWRIVAFANNLFNDDTVKQAFNSTDFSTISFGFFPPPFTFVLENALQAQLPDKRQVGVRASYSF